MKVSDRRKFEKANFDEFESALNNKNDLVHCPSITLFESIPTEVRSFYEDEKSGLIKVVKFRTVFRVLERCHEIASARPNDSSTMRTFTDFVSGAPIVRSLQKSTIRKYGYNLAPHMFLLLHVDELSIFSAYQASLPGEKKVDTERLKRDLCPRKPTEIKYFSQICNDMMNKKDRLGDVLATAQRIRRRYNKNGSSEPRLKTLDGLTSDYRWIQWLGLESDYHCSFSSTRNAEDVVAGEAASSDHHQKISRVTRKRPREPKSTNDILVAGRNSLAAPLIQGLASVALMYEIYMADTPSVAVQAPPGYGKTELFHLPLIALASKGDVKYVSFLFVPYTVLLANCMIRLGRRGCLNVAPVRNFIEEGYDGVTDLYVGIYDDLASTNFTDRIAAWENIVECTFRTNNVKLGYLIVDEFHNFETEVYRQSQFGGITNLDFDAFEKAIFLSGTAPEAVLMLRCSVLGLRDWPRNRWTSTSSNGRKISAEVYPAIQHGSHSRVGRLRDGGLCYLLSRKNSWAARNRKGELPPIKEGCITEQVREFYGLESKKGKKGQHVGCCGSRTDLSADTVELIERMDRLAENQATASMSIVALPSSFQESNSSDRCRKYCSSDEDSDTCIHGSANASTNATTNSSTNATTTASTNSSTSATTTASTNVRTSATTTASINVRTSATTTASINVRTSATTTKSINSNTNATTTASTNSSTNATTTASTNASTSATTTASTNSSTNATTTASTNSSTNATTTESTNASAKEDANKDGNAEDNRFHPVTDINKESYKRKGSQMVLLERKKLKAQFPNTSENMNVLQFLGFRSDEIKHLFLYGIDIYFCPEGVSHNTDYARAVKRCSSSVSVGLARKYRIGG
ncbi:DEAD/DEAH box helicase family protein [Saccharomyces cerevisiae]|nr:DEAD/DEAH box helicase family protein [Saccharomyces cerevisiae]